MFALMHVAKLLLQENATSRTEATKWCGLWWGCLRRAMVRIVIGRMIRLPASLNRREIEYFHHGPHGSKRWLVGNTKAMKRHGTEGVG